MNIIEALRVAWLALRTNKLRAFLTMLGIIIGIGAVIGLLAIGSGFQQFLNQQFNTFGVGVFYIGPFVESRKVNEQLRAQLTAADAAAIAQPGAAPAVRAVAVSYTGQGTVSAGQKRYTYAISGDTPDTFAINSGNKLVAGRYYYETEERDGARVALIGDGIAEQLYGGVGAAIGERITINGVGFEVIGVLSPKQANQGFGDPRKTVWVPYRTAVTRLFRNQVSPRVDTTGITVQAVDRNRVDEAIRQVTAILRQRHRLTYQNNDFTILSLDQILATVSGIISAFSGFLAVVGGISLLIGGIGIMNIMLVSVTERTREIGLRKAVGARQFDIMMQFLIEALVLCLIGGALGIGLGYLLSFAGTFVLTSVFQAEGAQATVTIGSILLATAISAAVGIFFGFFPALQAARLNPIDALRYE